MNVLKCSIVCAPIVFTFSPIAGQPASIAFEHFTSDNGLSAPVQKIVEDGYGFIWLGTTDGLNRFDGKNFVVYRNDASDPSSLANNIINALCVDLQGNVWAATNGGICYYNFEDDAFHHVAYPDSLEKLDRHRVHAVTADPKNYIWFATRTHVHKWYEGKTIETISFPDSTNLNILSLYVDRHNRLWAGTNFGVYLCDLSTRQIFHALVESPFTKEKKLSATVHPILPFRDDTLLVGSWYGGLQKIFFDGTAIRNIAYTDESQSDPGKHVIKGISPGANRLYWLGSYGNGLSVFNAHTSTFTLHFKNNPANPKSLGSNFVNDVYTDDAGILWIGTDVGLDKFDPFTQQFQSISFPQLPGEFAIYKTPSSFLEDPEDPSLLFMTVSGLGIYQYNTRSQQFTIRRNDPGNPRSLPDNAVYKLMRDRHGQNWVGMRSGLCLANDDFTSFTIPRAFEKEPIPGIHEIIQDQDGSFWLASFSNGIYHWNQQTGALTSYPHDDADPNSLPDNRVFCLLRDRKGFVWIGTQNRGLCRLDPKTGSYLFFESDKNKSGALPDNGIYDLYEDRQGRLWIATENGFAEMNLEDFSIRTYTTRDGLCNNDVFSITADPEGYFWLATNNGLSKFDPQHKTFKNYFISDGLPVNRLYGAVFLNSQGNLFIGTSGTISFCQPSMMQINRRIPPVVITHFKVFDQREPIMRQGSNLEPIRLSYKQNMITFDFAALNFTNSTLNQYAYRLEGFDDQWIYCGNKQSATFTNLDGGTYTFHVKAANNDGIWNEEGARVTITVRPPFWETWWFYVLCVLMAGGILYGIYRFRIQQLMKLQQIRMRISRDLHDDIGSTLSSINMISTMATEKNPADRKSAEWFRTISQASDQAMELMNDIVWSINPKNDRMEMILIRMRQYASEMLEAAQIPFSIAMDESCAHLSLPIEKRKDFYLIFKEAINNLAKYSHATQVEILMRYEHRLLTLHIRDNGIGFVPEQVQAGNGLKNMKARALQLKGELKMNTQPGQGTSIELILPVLP